MISMTKRPYAEALRSSGVGFSVFAAAWLWRIVPPCPQRRHRILAAALIGLSLLALWGGELRAREPLEVPLRRISREHRNEVRSILESPTLVRRLPRTAFFADSATYVYLLDNLPLSSRLSDLLEYGHYRVEQMPDGSLHGWDFSGIEGDFWLVHSSPTMRIYRGKGSYDSWLLPKVSGTVLMVVSYRKIPPADPESHPGVMETTLDVYVVTNRIVGFLMEVMGQVTDRKLSQLLTAAQLTSRELSLDPQGVWQKMDSSPLFTREELEDLRGALLR